MRCYIKKLKTLLCICAAHALIAHGEGIEVEKAEARLIEGSYQVSANFQVSLPPPVEEALKRGTTLYFISDFSVRRSRWYWMDSEIASSQQTTKLTFNILTQQYRLSSGALYQSFSELKDALRILGRQTAQPIAARLLDNSAGGYLAKLSQKGSKITVYVSMRLDISQLPKPLQVNALADNQWDVQSKKYHWDIRADAQEKAEP